MNSCTHSIIKSQLADIASFRRYCQPTRGRYGSHVTKFASKKNDISMACESLLEAAFCLTLERRPDVIDYEVHPFTICFTGSKYRYTPDFLIQFADGSIKLLEVKNTESFNDRATMVRITRYVELLAEQGCDLEYLSAEHFYCRVKTHNLQHLYHHAYLSDGVIDQTIKLLLTENSPQRFSIQNLIHSGFEYKDIAHALFYGVISTDLLRPLTLLNTVWS